MRAGGRARRGEVDGEPYLAEEFFEGHDLAEMSNVA